MAIDYSQYLTAEQKRNLLQQRIAQFAAEAWQHELNKKTCEQINDENGVANATAALSTLETAIAVHQDELNSLGDVTESA